MARTEGHTTELEYEVCVNVHWSPAKVGLELSDRRKDFMGEEMLHSQSGGMGYLRTRRGKERKGLVFWWVAEIIQFRRTLKAKEERFKLTHLVWGDIKDP